MKIINIKYTIVLAAALVFGCTGDFEEVNSNPNNPLTTTPNVLLPGLERDFINSVLGEAWSIGNVVVQQTAKNQFVNEDRYAWGERNGLWDAVYDNMRDVNNILTQATETNQPSYRGVGLVLKSWMFSIVTDAYGDVPYSQALNAKNGVIFPEYDTQESIYNGILADLKEANTILSTAVNITGDLIYDGDVSKWRKLANSLRLRYLMRISDRKDVSAEMAEIVNNPATNPVFGGNADHAVYTFLESAPNQFPMYTTRIGSFNETRASKTLVDFLANLGDPRLKVFFRPTPATEVTADESDDRYDGLVNGLNEVDALKYNGGQQNQARVGALYYERSNSLKGLSVAKGVIMTYAELQFVLAEAREKGLITTSTAEAYYTNGINASFEFYGLTAPAGYFAQGKVAYTGTQAERLEKIGNQKWAASFYQSMEAWFDWRRTGYPVLQPSANNVNSGRIPVRFIYPRIEQSLNSENREKAIGRQGADDLNSRVWWDTH